MSLDKKIIGRKDIGLKDVDEVTLDEVMSDEKSVHGLGDGHAVAAGRRFQPLAVSKGERRCLSLSSSLVRFQLEYPADGL